MLVLAIDTATPAVTAGVVELGSERVTVLAERVTHDARAHGELLTPHVLDAVSRAGATLRDLAAVVCGVGPGPFTGLRAGIVTAAALADSLDVPAYPVCSLDAIASDAVADGADAPFLVVTDARRREVYWAAYDREGHRSRGPEVAAPAALDPAARRVEHAHPSPAGLARTAATAIRASEAPAPLTPLYLRRPDAAVPGARKRVSAS
ncbi:tRNA (adenosine(37)-N6)-threonylcarbamoyltransferase complex dimerization subunit type 1 TsaB [Saccharomonospora piscinae]|uniref:tRNA (adenosine(37)-N6)-threonylcarbamoyltransferase complex dimerization subunit type 1 TsaB n=1 Tax=Saccharomonospora piscinae TaxID=687388 RepID=UPI001105FF38|nr:tRNA (adenosine(37)-N6)-threonylcarbamoyltransferase complex dimerization subunit type 1 TsaB [Saccharomonospora piscinae]TLW93815.1 tRNA (adenosine(37)-N6)-threonylcarbamoyltransferase complex dimerization subunit type 1 TsaB [Saccharomonospora piscinae]